MNKKLLTNCLVALFGICSFLLLNRYLVYLERNVYKMAYVKFLVIALFPLILGFVISLPLSYSNTNKIAIDWQKLIVQGIPAFLLGIPFQSLIILYMILLKIDSLDLGILNHIPMMQSQNPILNAVFGVWLGKVLADSIKLPKRTREVN